MASNQHAAFDPYPWAASKAGEPGVKLAVLYLMELPSNCSEEAYLKRWDEIFHPVRLGGNMNKQLLEKKIKELMAENKCSWTQAADLLVQTTDGRRLLSAQY